MTAAAAAARQDPQCSRPPPSAPGSPRRRPPQPGATRPHPPCPGSVPSCTQEPPPGRTSGWTGWALASRCRAPPSPRCSPLRRAAHLPEARGPAGAQRVGPSGRASHGPWAGRGPSWPSPARSGCTGPWSQSFALVPRGVLDSPPTAHICTRTPRADPGRRGALFCGPPAPRPQRPCCGAPSPRPGCHPSFWNTGVGAGVPCPQDSRRRN